MFDPLHGLPLPSLSQGGVHVLGPVAVPGLERERCVRVYVPRDHERGDAHRLFLLFDGQNLFGDEGSFAGGWHLHAQAEKLSIASRRGPIVVGIDHGHEQRISELSPWDSPRFGPGRLDSLLDWMTGTLVPALRRTLHIQPGPRGVVIGGSSLGGLAALYAHHRRPDAFGSVLAMSPSLWLGGQRIFEVIASSRPVESRIYLDCGALEAGGRMLPQVARLAGELRSRGYGDNHLLFRADRRGQHREIDWRRRFPRAARFLLK